MFKFVFHFVVLFQLVSFANSLEVIKGESTSQNIYEVVYESNKTETDKAPGIYGIHPKTGESYLIIAGNILGVNRGFNGVYAKIEDTISNSPSPIITIVDGKLVLLNRNSNANNKKSYLVLGSKETPIIDILVNRPISIPPITSKEDISKFKTDLNVSFKGETLPVSLVYFSVKADHPAGSGYTFIIPVVESKSDKSNVEILRGQPLLISYDYMEESQIRKMVNNGEKSKIISPFLIELYLARLKPQEHVPFLAKWTNHLKSQLKHMTPQKNTKNLVGINFNAVPYYDLDSGTIKIDEKVVDVITHSGSQKILQVYDPMKDSWSVEYVSNPLVHEYDGLFYTENENFFLKSGRAHVDVKTKKYKTIASEADSSSLIIPIENSFYYFDSKFSFLGLIPLDYGVYFTSLKNQSMYSFLHESLGRRYLNIIFSYITDRGSKATKHRVFELEGNSFRPVTAGMMDTITPEFYTSKELALRVKSFQSKDSSFIGFDLITPKIKPDDYNKKSIEGITTAFMNLSQGYVRSSQHLFLKPLETINFGSSKLSYKKFDETGVTSAAYSGLYIDKGGDSPDIIQGDLLTKSRKTTDDKFILEDATLVFNFESTPKNPINIKIFALDNSRKTKRKSKPGEVKTKQPTPFEIVVVATDTTKSTIGYIRHRVTEEAFESLKSIQIVQEKRTHENSFVTFLFFGPTKDFSGVKERAAAIHFSIDNGTETTSSNKVIDTLKVTLNGNTVLEDNGMTDAILKNRIKADALGRLYWVHDATITPEKSSYALRAFHAPSKLIYPNKEESRITLRHNEEIITQGKKENSLGGYWYISSKHTLFARIPQIEKELKDYKKSMVEGRKNYANLLMGLNEFLNQYANPNYRDRNLGRKVILVSDEFKPLFLKALYLYLTEGDGAFNLDHRKNQHMDFFLYDGSSTSYEAFKEFNRIRSVQKSRNTILFSALSDFLNTSLVIQNDPEDNESPISSSDISIVNTNEFESSEESESESSSEASSLESSVASNVQALDSSGDYFGEDSLALALEDVKSPLNRNDSQQRRLLSHILMLATDGQVKNLKGFWDAKDKLAPTIPTLIIATPKEWDSLKQKHALEFASGIEKQFDVDRRFLTSSWTVWPPDTNRAATATITAASTPVNPEEQRVFPSLNSLLLDAANGKLKGKKKILVVPDGLKSLVNRMILARWATKQVEVAGPWNNANKNLRLFQLVGDRSGNSQKAVLENLDTLRSVGNYNSSVLLADMEQILNIHSPALSQEGEKYVLSDPFKGAAGSSALSDDESDAKKTAAAKAPHLIWMLATEGHRIKLSSKKDWNLKEQIPGDYATVIVSTQNELEKLKSEIAFESRFLDIESHFEIIHFEPPSDHIRFELVNSLLSRNEVKALGLEFRIGDLSEDEAKRQLIYHLVNRTGQISEMKGMESTESFIRVFTEFRRMILEDVELRRSRVITREYVDRFFAKVFPMPLNPEILDKKDHIRRISDTDNFINAWREVGGYQGSRDLKSRFLATVLSQTRPTDAGKPIPSSTILFGGTSTGKTFLVESLFNMFEMKMYDPNKSNNEEAEAIIVKVSNLVEISEQATQNKISVDDMIAHIEDLLAQPKGYRSWILFDDLHKAATKEIYLKLMTFIQSLLDNEHGTIRVRKKKGDSFEIRETPVQNLNLIITLNPESDKEVVKRFAENSSDLKGHVLAALSRNDFKVEGSLLARFSDIINMDAFPRNAKVPALVTRIREQSQQLPHIVLVERDAIDKLVNSYPNANAREFLAPAAAALTSIPPIAKKSSLYIVTPNETPVSTQSRMDTYSISKTARDLSNVTAIDSTDMHSQLKLISFVLNNFRTTIFNNLILEAESSKDLDFNVPGLSSSMRKNFVFASATYAISNPKLPIAELVIRPDDVPNLSTGQYHELYEKQRALKETSSYFPFEFSIREVQSNYDPRGFVDEKAAASIKSQVDVLSEYVKRTEEVLLSSLKLFLRFEEDQDIRLITAWKENDVREWFERLDNKDKDKLLRIQISKLITLFKEFNYDIYNPELEQNITQGKPLSMYDISKLFAFVMDKAITRLPWGLVSNFVMDVTELSRDLSLGQKPAFMKYTFHEMVSPFAISTFDILTDVTSEIKNNPNYAKLIAKENINYSEVSTTFGFRNANQNSCSNFFR